MYIITYTSGSWDSFHRGTLFVTEDEELAKSYCKKAMGVLSRIKEFYIEIDSRIDVIGESEDDEEGVNLKLWCKYNKVSEVNIITYEPIEKR